MPTIEKAIELVRDAFSAWKEEYYCSGEDWTEENEARDLAIDALKKQDPMIPDVWGDGYADGEPVIDMWNCPSCGTTYEIEGEQHDYCPNCGQKIDWNTRDFDI